MTTDTQGNYSFVVPAGWSGTVTPSKSGFIFLPVSLAYSDLSGNQADQDFVADSALPLISGVVTTGEIGISGVNLFFTGLGTANTNGAGFYYMPVPNGWSGIATPSRAGSTFEPEFRDYYGVTFDYPDQGFNADGDGGGGGGLPGTTVTLYTPPDGAIVGLSVPMTWSPLTAAVGGYHVEVSYGGGVLLGRPELALGVYGSEYLRRRWFYPFLAGTRQPGGAGCSARGPPTWSFTVSGCRGQRPQHEEEHRGSAQQRCAGQTR